MDRIVFSNLSMKDELFEVHYPVDGNSELEYEGMVRFPINAVLARTMQKGDRVTVVLLAKEYKDNKDNSAGNEKLFKEELDKINSNIGAVISYDKITTPFVETEAVHEQLYSDMAHKLKKGAHIIGDITYGPKPLALVVFMVMNFAEKFFGCEIDYIVYGKVEFVNNKPENPMIYDLTPLYYLNSLTNTLDFDSKKSSEKALKSLDAILSIGKAGKE